MKISCGVSKRPGRFFIKVCWHIVAFSTRLMKLSIVPAIFISTMILSSFEIIAKTLSVALEVSLSIFINLGVYL